MKTTIKILTLVVFIPILIIIAYVTIFSGGVNLKPANHSIFTSVSANDSVVLESRQMGYINLSKFLQLATRNATNHSFDSLRDVQRFKDSIRFRVNINSEKMFYGEKKETLLKKQYPGATHLLDTEFTAHVKSVDGIEYCYIPYEILVSVSNTGTHYTTHQIQQHNASIADSSTIDSQKAKQLQQYEPHGDKKVQVEGLVWRNTREILQKHNMSGDNRLAQLECIHKYVKDHWFYIHDPNTKEDMWRSANETIENYYIDGGHYSGDCDDYAILMASFAQQLGFESRVVCAYDEYKKTGHAYAEFHHPIDSNTYDNKNWHSLDWFGEFMGIPFSGKVIKRIDGKKL